jgi:hypothetical protein
MGILFCCLTATSLFGIVYQTCARLAPAARVGRAFSRGFMHAAEETPPTVLEPAFPHGDGLFDNRELSTIAMIAAIHFVVSFVARLGGTVIFAIFGPFSVYIDGIASEGVPCLLVAVILTLIPRVGTATLTIGTVFLLNGIVSGSFSVNAFILVGVSIVAHEAILFLLGVTKLERTAPASATAGFAVVTKTALAIGCANAAALYVQFYIAMNFGEYKLVFDPWYVHSVALITGLLFGAIGAAIGTCWGYELRRTAP